MPSITIELTDEEYQTAQALPKSEQRRAVMLAANEYATARNESPDELTSEAELVAIGEGLADLDAGRVIDGETVFAELRARRQARQAQRGSSISHEQVTATQVRTVTP
ncbi:MAG: hypothetical protein EOP06_06840 [Proteobacteria bacterium]|nr:MAG: hypothetical protein EOP06_06840 [Pseudomonadota bacterium]